MQGTRVALPMSSAATRSTNCMESSVVVILAPSYLAGIHRVAARGAEGQRRRRTRVLETTMQGPVIGSQRQTT
jgi:hypothetical protein